MTIVDVVGAAGLFCLGFVGFFAADREVRPMRYQRPVAKLDDDIDSDRGVVEARKLSIDTPKVFWADAVLSEA